MAERPYTLLSCAVSLDGYLSDADGGPLKLSNDLDLDRVDAVRASCDAILVGAATVRSDNPRLQVRSPARRRRRLDRGTSASPIKVTLTRGGQLDSAAAFFTVGDGEKLVYCATAVVDATRDRLGSLATVIDGGSPPDLHHVGADLHSRGVAHLMVEGGAGVLTQFLTADLADELQLVVAPFFVGSGTAPRFVGEGSFPWHSGRRADLAEVRQLDDVVLLRYALSPRFNPDPRPDAPQEDP